VSRLTLALEFVLRHEGGLANDAADRGGLTKFGISQRSYPHLDISGLSVEQAIEIYAADFWQPIQADQLPYPIALAVFDTAVNSGVKTAVRMLQELIGTTADGIIGPKTLAALAHHQPGALAQQYCWARMRFLVRIVKRNLSQVRFLAGWTNRVSELAEECALWK
jgi:lysozyme family protein